MEKTLRQVRTKTPEILVMEDEMSLAKGLRMILEKEGYHVDTASTGHSARDVLRRKGFDLLVADLRLPDMDGMDIIREVKEKRPETKTIVITGYPSISSAVDAMKLGVADYLPKPFWDDEFKQAVEKALEGDKEVYLKEEPDISHLHQGVCPEGQVEHTAKRQPTERPTGPQFEEERLIQRREVIRVLERASRDLGFWRDLLEAGSAVLRDYYLTTEPKAAILSGDLRWITENIGELNQKQLMFIYKRLEREAW